MCVVTGANHLCEEYVDKASCQKANKNTLVVELENRVEPMSFEAYLQKYLELRLL